MEPVEINAGAWYLRALRADERVDDRPALAELGETDPDYVARRAAQWRAGSRYSWAVSEPSTGEMIAEVVVDPVAATGRTRWRDAHAAAADTAAASVQRYLAAAHGATVVWHGRDRQRGG